MELIFQFSNEPTYFCSIKNYLKLTLHINKKLFDLVLRHPIECFMFCASMNVGGSKDRLLTDLLLTFLIT